MKKNLETATLGGGCFWCTEAIFKRLKGVEAVVSGYVNGAESVRITFNPQIISFEKILDVFWHLHNPTTLNQQGNDVGPQYRSVIFYHSLEQKKIAQQSKENIEKEGLYKDPIVTKIEPVTSFYKAEAHHQNYYDRNQDYPYCQYVIDPKIQKLMKEFGEYVKKI